MSKKRGVRDIKSLARKKHDNLEMTLLVSENEKEEEIDVLIEGNIADVKDIELYSRRAAAGYQATVERVSGIHPSILIELRVQLYTKDLGCPVAAKCERAGSHGPYCAAGQHEKCGEYKRLTRK